MIKSELTKQNQAVDLQSINNNISLCIESINLQAKQAENAKNLTGLFAGKKRDSALADALVISSQTQVQIINLIKESIKLFFYCFSIQENNNSMKKEEMLKLIMSNSNVDSQESKEFIQEITQVMVEYDSQLKKQMNSIKRKLNVAYCVSGISLLIGVVSIILK